LEGGLSSSGYNSFTQQSSNFVVNYSLGGSDNSNLGQLKPPSNFDLFPIGAFYDSQSAAYDNAPSIANKTTRAMDASGQALSAAQLAALDANADGILSVQEASSVRLWADLNENGQLDTNELQSVGSLGNWPTAVALAAASFAASGLPAAQRQAVGWHGQ
jgi:hypothetical protein